MGKTGKWIRNLLIGKKEREKEKEKDLASRLSISPGNGNQNYPTTPMQMFQGTPKEKRRWSFRRSSEFTRSSATLPGQKDVYTVDIATTPSAQRVGVETDSDPKKQAVAVAVATAAAADAAIAAAKAAAAIFQITAAAGRRRTSGREEAAAIKIQSVFRSYLARRALKALKGLVKLQAMVRGYLVRKQAIATFRCMQALVTVQAVARARRFQMAEETKTRTQKEYNPRKSTQENKFRHSDQDLEENIKIVEMDLEDSKASVKVRNIYSNHARDERRDHKKFTQCSQTRPQISPTSSATTQMSLKNCSSGHLEEHSSCKTQSSLQCVSTISVSDEPRIVSSYPQSDYAESLCTNYPSYMANTESSRAKSRSHSVPKQRPADYHERQQSRRRTSMEEKNVPRSVRMQRSSSQVGSSAQVYQCPWSVKFDASVVSPNGSACGSTSTVHTSISHFR